MRNHSSVREEAPNLPLNLLPLEEGGFLGKKGGGEGTQYTQVYIGAALSEHRIHSDLEKHNKTEEGSKGV